MIELLKRAIIFILLILGLLAPKVVFAQTTPEEAAKKHGITFPVAELGNCNSVSECRTYCEDPSYKEACVTFAKRKGLDKKEAQAVKKEEFLDEASTELGCDSKDSCKALCSEEENWEKCGEFAKKHRLAGGHKKDPTSGDILEKAKHYFGCDSHESCKALCSLEENKQKCDEFARLVGLKGGVEKKGPGGCTSEESCKKYCQEHQEECKKFRSHMAKIKGEDVPKYTASGSARINSENTRCNELKALFDKGHFSPENKEYFAKNCQNSNKTPSTSSELTPNCKLAFSKLSDNSGRVSLDQISQVLLKECQNSSKEALNKFIGADFESMCKQFEKECKDGLDKEKCTEYSIQCDLYRQLSSGQSGLEGSTKPPLFTTPSTDDDLLKQLDQVGEIDTNVQGVSKELPLLQKVWNFVLGK